MTYLSLEDDSVSLIPHVRLQGLAGNHRRGEANLEEREIKDQYHNVETVETIENAAQLFYFWNSGEKSSA